jgi:hypothetical protein
VGFKRERTVYKLTFSETELDGLEVEASSVSTGTLMKLMKLAVEIGDNGKTSGTDITAMDELFTGFTNALQSWNLEDDDGSPVPATLDGLYAQDLDVAMPIVMAWINAVAGVGVELGKGLTSGPSFQEASLPMAPS